MINNQTLENTKRLALRLQAWSTLLAKNRLASEPEGNSREKLYEVNKLMLQISEGLGDESRLLILST